MVIKTFIYMAFTVAFIVIFQQNPLVGVILIAIVGCGYLYFKSRKNKGGTRILRSGRVSMVQDQTQTLLIHMLLQQLSNGNNNGRSPDNELKRGCEPDELKNEHQKARDELLQLLK